MKGTNDFVKLCQLFETMCTLPNSSSTISRLTSLSRIGSPTFKKKFHQQIEKCEMVIKYKENMILCENTQPLSSRGCFRGAMNRVLSILWTATQQLAQFFSFLSHTTNKPHHQSNNTICEHDENFFHKLNQSKNLKSEDLFQRDKQFLERSLDHLQRRSNTSPSCDLHWEEVVDWKVFVLLEIAVFLMLKIQMRTNDKKNKRMKNTIYFRWLKSLAFVSDLSLFRWEPVPC